MNRAILSMHLVALLWGIAGVLGAITTLDSTVLVTSRSLVAMAAVIVFFGPRPIRDALELPARERVALVLTGLFLGLHWIFFFRAIHLGSVALALVTYAAGPALIAAAEVLLGWAPPRAVIFLGAFVSWAGVWCIHPVRSLDELLHPGFVSGVLSVLAIVLVGLSAKRLLRRQVSPLAVTVGQLVGALLVAAPFASFRIPAAIETKDLLVIVGLGVFCSALGQSLFNRALTSVRASTASIIATMETPYGVVLAALLISEPFTTATLLGTLLVTVSALIVSVPAAR